MQTEAGVTVLPATLVQRTNGSSRFVPSWSGARPAVLPLAFAVVVTAVLEWVIRSSHVSAMLLVPPSAVWAQLAGSWSVLLPQALPTALDAIGGYLIGAVLGISIGAALVTSRRIEQSFWPYVLVFQLIPKVALAPLFIIWLGVGPSSRLAFAVFLSFFPPLIATMQGLRAADPTIVRLCRSLRATPQQIFMQVRLVYSLPQIFAGLRIGVTAAMIGVIVGEFVTAQQGLGYIITYAVSAGQTALAYAAIVLVCAIGLALYGIVALIEFVVCRRFHVPMSTSGY